MIPDQGKHQLLPLAILTAPSSNGESDRMRDAVDQEHDYLIINVHVPKTFAVGGILVPLSQTDKLGGPARLRIRSLRRKCCTRGCFRITAGYAFSALGGMSEGQGT